MRYTDLLNKVEINGKQFVAAQYKGIPFYVEGSSVTDGRRIKVNELPSSTPIFEDIGRVTNLIDIPAYFLDYKDIYSAIEQYHAAMTTWNGSEGSGELIHPELQGILSARSGVTPASFSNKMGIVKFNITFYIEEIEVEKKSTINFANEIDTQSISVIDSLNADFNKFFEVINQPQQIFDSAVDSTRDVLSGIETLKAGLRQTAGYRDKLFQIQQNLEVIVLDAESLANDLIDIVTYKPDNETSDKNMMDDNFNLSAYPKKEIATGVIVDEIVEQEYINNTQLNQLVTVTSLTELSKFSKTIELNNVRDANDLIVKINESYNNLLLDTTDFSLYSEVQKLQTLTVDNLELRAKELPSIRHYTTRDTTSIFNVTQSFYGNDFSNAENIIKRNNIEHAMFVPGETELELLV